MATSIARKRRYGRNLTAASNMRHGGWCLLSILLVSLENALGHLLAGIGVDIAELILGSKVV